jgi:multidrug resistance efflux pump
LQAKLADVRHKLKKLQNLQKLKRELQVALRSCDKELRKQNAHCPICRTGVLKQWGVPQKEIARLESTGQMQQELEVDSPASGYITERNALPAVAVQPEMRLYTIADLSTVWVQAQVFQNDLERTKIGAP